MKLTTFSNQKEFIQAGVQALADVLTSKPGKVYVGLSGGSTPRPIYEAFAGRMGIDWDRIEFYLVDERFVPRHDPDSNYKMIAEAFLAAPDFKKHYHYFDTSKPAGEAAMAFEAELQKIPGQSLDLIILGIGQDGHTASLFPGSPALGEERRLAMETVNESAPHPPVRERLTMTWPMILKAKKILLLAAGAGKRQVLDDLADRTKKAEELPAKRLLESKNFEVYYLDR